jgi:hypothetical protein
MTHCSHGFATTSCDICSLAASLMARHSPAPWSVNRLLESGKVIGFHITEGNSGSIDPICEYKANFPTRRTPDELAANSALLAAAPDLLKALHEISKGLGRRDPDPLKHADNCIEDMKSLALAAIANVEGK